MSTILQGVSPITLQKLEKTRAGKIIIVSGLWFGLVIFSIYSAAIVAQFQTNEDAIQSLEELLKNKYKIISLQGLDVVRSIVFVRVVDSDTCIVYEMSLILILFYIQLGQTPCRLFHKIRR